MSGEHPRVPKRRQQLTRLGLHFLFVGVFAMLGGALRGFNLLLVLAGLLVAALLMQWRWSRRIIEAISVTRRLPAEAFAGRPFPIRYLLQNHSRVMPAWLIRIDDQIQSTDQDTKASAISGVGIVPSRGAASTSCDCLILRRGRYRFGPMQLTTTFPFALFSSKETAESVVEFQVFPRIYSLRARWRERLSSHVGGVATTVRRSGTVEGDFFGLREWQTGDNPKWIHWRTTARINELAVRQFEQQRRFDTCILVDAFCVNESDEAIEAVEATISLAATLVVQLVAAPSNRTVLAVAGKSSDAIIGGGSSAGKRRMLGVLADVSPSSSPRLSEAAGKAMKMVGSTQDLIVVSPRSMASVKEIDHEFGAGINPWLRRGTLRWINVQTELADWVVREGGSRELDSANPKPMVMSGNESSPTEVM